MSYLLEKRSKVNLSEPYGVRISFTDSSDILGSHRAFMPAAKLTGQRIGLDWGRRFRFRSCDNTWLYQHALYTGCKACACVAFVVLWCVVFTFAVFWQGKPSRKRNWHASNGQQSYRWPLAQAEWFPGWLLFLSHWCAWSSTRVGYGLSEKQDVWTVVQESRIGEVLLFALQFLPS